MSSVSELPKISNDEKKKRLAQTESEFIKRRRLEFLNFPKGTSRQEVEALLKGFSFEQIQLETSTDDLLVHVLFTTIEQAKSALSKFNNFPFKGVHLSALYSQSTFLLYIGNLPYDYKYEEFHKLVSSYGQVERSFLVYSEFSGHSKGYGYVEFKNLPDCNKARLSLSRHKMNGNLLRVDNASFGLLKLEDLHSKTLHIAGILPNTKQNEIEDLIKMEAKILHCQVGSKWIEGKRNCYAMVDVASVKETEQVWCDFDDCVVGNAQIKITFAQPLQSTAFVMGMKPNNLSLDDKLIPRSIRRKYNLRLFVKNQNAPKIEKNEKTPNNKQSVLPMHPDDLKQTSKKMKDDQQKAIPEDEKPSEENEKDPKPRSFRLPPAPTLPQVKKNIDEKGVPAKPASSNLNPSPNNKRPLPPSNTNDNATGNKYPKMLDNNKKPTQGFQAQRFNGPPNRQAPPGLMSQVVNPPRFNSPRFQMTNRFNNSSRFPLSNQPDRKLDEQKTPNKPNIPNFGRFDNPKLTRNEQSNKKADDVAQSTDQSKKTDNNSNDGSNFNGRPRLLPPNLKRNASQGPQSKENDFEKPPKVAGGQSGAQGNVNPQGGNPNMFRPNFPGNESSPQRPLFQPRTPNNRESRPPFQPKFGSSNEMRPSNHQSPNNVRPTFQGRFPGANEERQQFSPNTSNNKSPFRPRFAGGNENRPSFMPRNSGNMESRPGMPPRFMSNNEPQTNRFPGPGIQNQRFSEPDNQVGSITYEKNEGRQKRTRFSPPEVDTKQATQNNQPSFSPRNPNFQNQSSFRPNMSPLGNNRGPHNPSPMSNNRGPHNPSPISNNRGPHNPPPMSGIPERPTATDQNKKNDSSNFGQDFGNMNQSKQSRFGGYENQSSKDSSTGFSNRYSGQPQQGQPPRFPLNGSSQSNANAPNFGNNPPFYNNRSGSDSSSPRFNSFQNNSPRPLFNNNQQNSQANSFCPPSSNNNPQWQQSNAESVQSNMDSFRSNNGNMQKPPFNSPAGNQQQSRFGAPSFPPHPPQGFNKAPSFQQGYKDTNTSQTPAFQQQSSNLHQNQQANQNLQSMSSQSQNIKQNMNTSRMPGPNAQQMNPPHNFNQFSGNQNLPSQQQSSQHAQFKPRVPGQYGQPSPMQQTPFNAPPPRFGQFGQQVPPQPSGVGAPQFGQTIQSPNQPPQQNFGHQNRHQSANTPQSQGSQPQSQQFNTSQQNFGGQSNSQMHQQFNMPNPKLTGQPGSQSQQFNTPPPMLGGQTGSQSQPFNMQQQRFGEQSPSQSQQLSTPQQNFTTSNSTASNTGYPFGQQFNKQGPFGQQGAQGMSVPNQQFPQQAFTNQQSMNKPVNQMTPTSNQGNNFAASAPNMPTPMQTQPIASQPNAALNANPPWLSNPSANNKPPWLMNPASKQPGPPPPSQPPQQYQQPFNATNTSSQNPNLSGSALHGFMPYQSQATNQNVMNPSQSNPNSMSFTQGNNTSSTASVATTTTSQSSSGSSIYNPLFPTVNYSNQNTASPQASQVRTTSYPPAQSVAPPAPQPAHVSSKPAQPPLQPPLPVPPVASNNNAGNQPQPAASSIKPTAITTTVSTAVSGSTSQTNMSADVMAQANNAAQQYIQYYQQWCASTMTNPQEMASVMAQVSTYAYQYYQQYFSQQQAGSTPTEPPAIGPVLPQAPTATKPPPQGVPAKTNNLSMYASKPMAFGFPK